MKFVYKAKFAYILLYCFLLCKCPISDTEMVIDRLLNHVGTDTESARGLLNIFDQCKTKPEDVSLKIKMKNEMRNKYNVKPLTQNGAELLNEEFFLLRLVKKIHEKCKFDYPFMAIDCYNDLRNKSMGGLKICDYARGLIEEIHRGMPVREDTVIQEWLFGYTDRENEKNTVVYFNKRFRIISIIKGEEILGKIDSKMYNFVTVSSRHYSMLVISLMFLPNNLTIFHNVFLNLPFNLRNHASLVHFNQRRIFYEKQHESVYFKGLEVTIPTMFGEMMYFDTNRPIKQNKRSDYDAIEDINQDEPISGLKYRYIFLTTVCLINGKHHVITKLLGIKYSGNRILNLMEPITVTTVLIYRYISFLHRKPIPDMLDWLNNFRGFGTDRIAHISDLRRIVDEIEDTKTVLRPYKFNFRKGMCSLEALLARDEPVKVDHMIGVFSQEVPRIAYWNDLYSRLAHSAGERINEYTNLIDFCTESRLEVNSRNGFLVPSPCNFPLDD